MKPHAPSPPPVSFELSPLGLKLGLEDGLGVIASGNKQLSLGQCEMLSPRQEESRLLIAKNQLRDIDQALESLQRILLIFSEIQIARTII
jgi:hypothetical protein